MEILKIGTKGVAARDLVADGGTIYKGECITIVDIDTAFPSRGYTVVSENGIQLFECGFDCIIPDHES